jgi:hypothetical protein
VSRFAGHDPGCDATASRLAASPLALFGPLFTAPSFRTFCVLACGFLAQTGTGAVCGMLADPGLAA